MGVLTVTIKKKLNLYIWVKRVQWIDNRRFRCSHTYRPRCRVTEVTDLVSSQTKIAGYLANWKLETSCVGRCNNWIENCKIR